jgi:hypothetical protein
MTDSDTVRCPFCNVASAQLVSLFGSQLLLSQYRCGLCGSYFEGVRPDRWDADPVANEAPVTRVCDHPREPALPATGENDDGR